MPDMSKWLERELAKNLAPVRAPHALWGKITAAQASHPVRRISTQLAFWPVAALVVLGAAAGWTQVDRHSPLDYHRIALEDLRAAHAPALSSSRPHPQLVELTRLGSQSECRTCHTASLL